MPLALPNLRWESLRATGTVKERFLLQKVVDMGRKSTGKRLRFEIFKRDNFTCQYCGSQPPDIVLVLDHIHPISKGGDNDPMNLIASCEPCNQGKADKELGSIAPRPDADLEWLQMQQEISELRRYQTAKSERDKLYEEIAEDLTVNFEFISQFTWKTEMIYNGIQKMVLSFPPENVEKATKITAQKIADSYIDKYDWERYTYGILNNLENEIQGEL